MKWNWTAKLQRNYYYASRHRYKGEQHAKELIYMQHAVYDFHGITTPSGYVIDHINRDGLDNRFDNLRLVTLAQNAVNAKQRLSKTGYLGVRWDNRKALYVAYLTVNGKEKFVCYADYPETAARYRDMAALKLYENATLNFPELAVEAGKQKPRLQPYIPTSEELEFLANHTRIKNQPKRRAKLGL